MGEPRLLALTVRVLTIQLYYMYIYIYVCMYVYTLCIVLLYIISLFWLPSLPCHFAAKSLRNKLETFKALRSAVCLWLCMEEAEAEEIWGPWFSFSGLSFLFWFFESFFELVFFPTSCFLVYHSDSFFVWETFVLCPPHHSRASLSACVGQSHDVPARGLTDFTCMGTKGPLSWFV